MKICSVVGARPQFIKAAPLSTAIRNQATEILVHTGQHFDQNMSDVFFSELEIPKPEYNLNISVSSHAEQTGQMMVELEKLYLKEKPDLVLVYGDTNSTLAGALAASKIHIPIAHVEAGLRSFNRNMPEEINRVLTDHVSRWLFVPSDEARKNLSAEGITNNVFEVGDLMYDAVLKFSKKASTHSNILERLELQAGSFLLLTLHRAENVDSREHLENIISALASVESKILLPLHPRTAKRLQAFKLELPNNVQTLEPLGYLDNLQLLENSRGLLTDSGGMQKEAYYLNVPCITLRSETEWVETVEVGWNQLVHGDFKSLKTAESGLDAVRKKEHPALYGNGSTAELICNRLFS